MLRYVRWRTESARAFEYSQLIVITQHPVKHHQCSGCPSNFARVFIGDLNMRTTPFLFSILGATLISAGVVSAQAAEGVFYDPSNAASSTGKTIGYELYRTIGCPGRQLLDAPCKVPAPEPVAAAPEPAPAPAYV